MVKLLDKLFNSKLARVILLYGVLIILFHVFKNSINRSIERFLTIESESLEQVSIVWFLILSFVGLIYTIYKLLLKKYHPSTNFIHTAFLSTIVFGVLRFTNYPDKWEFISIEHVAFYYIDLLGFPLIVTVALLLKRLIYKYQTKKIEITKNPFVADDPIESEAEDKLNYRKRANDLISYLNRSQFKKSFTIGIVGPWGNGKSSLISLIEKELEKKPLKETLHLKFLPYLNHNENDIISEFFRQLSTEINKYSGQLSNQILEYSDKLLKLYRNKNIKEFLTLKTGTLANSSSYDTYRKINSILEDLNKKFIVFVDDLDRLSNKEVMQVLKLVRNTANFKNFIFIIALDKDYVLNTLMQKNDISDHTFVDKFFQLEVYLPEIEKNQLKKDFIEFLKISDLQAKKEFIFETEKAIHRKDNLFDDYISNHRGLKRLVNQLVFDFHSLPDQLNTNDFINFTYLKMTFPSAIKFLNSNWSSMIPYNRDTKLCELEEVDSNGGKNDTYDIIKNSRLYYGGGNYIPDYSKYKISKSLVNQEELVKLNNLSYHQNLLLAKTLIVLFGKDNLADGHTSIKFGNNLRKLLQQKVVENELTYTQFESIFNFEDNFFLLRKALKAGQTQNILDRISFYNTHNSEKAKSVVLVLLFIFNNAETYGTYSSSILQILSNFITRIKSKEKSKETKEAREELWGAIKKEFLDGDYNIERKLEFLAFLSENRIRMSFDDWGTDENTLKELSLYHYKNLLEKKQNNLWNLHDYSFYHSYHNARKFLSEEVLNPITIKFWENNDVTMLCAQMTGNDAWTTKVFKTSDFAAQLFGSKANYKSFIENRISDSDKLELKEYLEFLRLESYTNFSHHVRFEFVHFDMIKEKMQRVIDTNDLRNDEFENVVEIFISSSDDDIQRVSETNVSAQSIPGFISFLKHYSDIGFYSSMRVKSGSHNEAISELLKHYVELLNRKDEGYTISPDKTSIIKGEKTAIRIVSIQPESYNPNKKK